MKITDTQAWNFFLIDRFQHLRQRFAFLFRIFFIGIALLYFIIKFINARDIFSLYMEKMKFD